MEISSINSAAAGAQSFATQKVKAEPAAATTAEPQSQPSSQGKITISNLDDGSVSSKSIDTEDFQGTTLGDMKEISKLVNDQTVAEFGYNEPTHRITITIKDKETGDVIKEIPSEKILKMVAKAWEIAGLMVDEKR